MITAHLFGNGGTQVGIIAFCRQKHRLQIRIDALVDQRHLKFIFKIRDSPQPLDEHIAAVASGVFRHQPVVQIRRHIGQVPGDAPDKFDPLLCGENRMLPRIRHDTDNQPVKDLRRAFYDVEMAKGDRIKTAGVNRDFHRQLPPSGLVSI